MPREVEGILDGQDLLSRTGGKSMNERPYSSDPADVLVDVIVRQQREGLLDGLRQVLEHGPPGQAPDSSDIVRHKWFWPLGEDDKAMVLDSIRQSIDRALLGAMMALDSPFHVGDQIYEPVLYLDVYEDEEAWAKDRPSYRTKRVNDPAADPDSLAGRYILAIDKSDGGTDA